MIETPGGAGEVAEDIVKLLRGKYQDLAAIVPGAAKSAGTIIVMAADDILMEPASALGPIDAQIQWQGKSFSAEALLEGIKAIQQEVQQSGKLNLAYLPMLQQISPGEIQHAKNALTFARELVQDWLATYKFKGWIRHGRTGEAVTDEERKARAGEVARALANHTRWLTHGRSIKLADLEAMGLKITDYGNEPELMDAVRRYHTLLRMLFDTADCYKVIETSVSQIYRFTAPPIQVGIDLLEEPVAQPAGALARMPCDTCGQVMRIRSGAAQEPAEREGVIPWPQNDTLKCPSCGAEHDLAHVRRKIEAPAAQPVVA
jgi:ClpP class serine protease